MGPLLAPTAKPAAAAPRKDRGWIRLRRRQKGADGHVSRISAILARMDRSFVDRLRKAFHGKHQEEQPEANPSIPRASAPLVPPPDPISLPDQANAVPFPVLASPPPPAQPRRMTVSNSTHITCTVRACLNDDGTFNITLGEVDPLQVPPDVVPVSVSSPSGVPRFRRHHMRIPDELRDGGISPNAPLGTEDWGAIVTYTPDDSLDSEMRDSVANEQDALRLAGDTNGTRHNGIAHETDDRWVKQGDQRSAVNAGIPWLDRAPRPALHVDTMHQPRPASADFSTPSLTNGSSSRAGPTYCNTVCDEPRDLDGRYVAEPSPPSRKRRLAPPELQGYLAPPPVAGYHTPYSPVHHAESPMQLLAPYPAPYPYMNPLGSYSPIYTGPSSTPFAPTDHYGFQDAAVACAEMLEVARYERDRQGWPYAA